MFVQKNNIRMNNLTPLFETLAIIKTSGNVQQYKIITQLLKTFNEMKICEKDLHK